jgi:hypothetical protein
MVAAFAKALDTARRLDDVEYQLRALWGLWFYYIGIGRFHTAQPFAQEFHSLAQRSSDQNDQIFAKTMLASAEHYVGSQLNARLQLEQLLTQGAVSDHGWDDVHFRDVIWFGMGPASAGKGYTGEGALAAGICRSSRADGGAEPRRG